MSICASELQPLKTPKQIFLTEEGIVIFLSEMQSLKASKRISVAEEGIVNSSNDLQPQNILLGILPKLEESSTCLSELQLMKQLPPMHLTELGIIISSNAEHPLKGHSSNCVIVGGIIIFFNEVQFEKALISK